MLPPGHIAASYILVKSAEIFGFKISLPEIMLILVASIVLDFDLIASYFTKKMHHDLITHTPLGVFCIWLVFVSLFGKNITPATKILVLFSFLLHLFLDHLSYWLNRLDFQELGRIGARINWLYPVRKFKKVPALVFPTFNFFLKNHLFSFFADYFKKAKTNVFLEIVLSIIAILLI